MGNKRTDSSWPEVWGQVQTVIEKHGAPEEVRRAARPSHVGFNCGNDGKAYLFLPEILYRWIEVPASPDEESNLRFIKPLIWPLMQRYKCKDLIYKLID